MREFQKIFTDLIKELHDSIHEHNILKPRKNNYYNIVVQASYVKQLEYLYQISLKENKSNIFFFMPVMRGACEDLIALKYIDKTFQLDKNEIVNLLMNQENYAKLKAQNHFFDKYKSEQTVLTHKIYPSYKPIRNKISELLEKNGIKNNKLPPVESMAKEVDLIDIYNYLYIAATDLVHFRVGPLLKMGWSATKNDKKTFKFSTKNFNNYYFNFLAFYSTFLFVEYCKTFKKVINLKNRKWRIIKELEELLLTSYDYPEFVTFEELNLKRPSRIIETLMRVYRQNNAT